MNKTETIPGKNPFKVPENYFEDVNMKIISATSGYGIEKERKGIFSRFRPYILTAAAIAGFILLSYATVSLLNRNRSGYRYDRLSVISLPESYLNELDLSALEDNVTVTDMTENMHEIQNSDIVDYLILENIEIYDIYEQL